MAKNTGGLDALSGSVKGLIEGILGTNKIPRIGVGGLFEQRLVVNQPAEFKTLTLAKDTAPRETADHTKQIVVHLSDLTDAMNASLAVSQDMRDTAKESAASTARSGLYALIIAGASLAVSIAALAVALVHH